MAIKIKWLLPYFLLIVLPAEAQTPQPATPGQPVTSSANWAACQTTDKATINEINGKLTELGNAPVGTGPYAGLGLGAYDVLVKQRLQAITQRTNDCAAACQLDKKQDTTLATQMANLMATRNEPQNTGPASADFQRRVNQLQQQISGEEAITRADCALVQAALWNASAVIKPAYMILAVVYAPPGAKGGSAGGAASSVDYLTQSSLGTSVSVSNSFTDKLSIDAKFTGGAFGDDASLDLGFSSSVDKTDKSQIDITKTQKGEIKIPGPSNDGVDHDSDRIYLWLNPRVTLSQTAAERNWALDVDGTTMAVNYVEVGWLKHPETIPKGLLQQFGLSGITPADYQVILSADPFAGGSSTIDKSRYVELSTSYPYEPTASAPNSSGTDTVTLTSETKDTSGTSVDTSQSLSITVDAKVNAVFADAELKVSDKFTYGHSEALQSSQDSLQSASFTIAQPSAGYTGPTSVFVYWDTIFQTFLFQVAPYIPENLVVTGTVTDMTGKPISHQEVTATFTGVRFRTFTDSRGVYRIADPAVSQQQAKGTLSVAGLTTAIVAGPKAAPHNMQIPR